MFVHELYCGMAPIVSSFGSYKSSLINCAAMGEQGVCDFLYTAEIPYISTTGTKDANISSFVANSYTGLGKSGACGVHYCGEEGA